MGQLTICQNRANLCDTTIEMGHKMSKTCQCRQVIQITGQNSNFKYNNIAKNAFFLPENLQLAKIDQKYLRQL